jgi:hypothetical protein
MMTEILCPIDKNKTFIKPITIYNVGIDKKYCEPCIKNKLLICSICGIFKIKGDIITKENDPNRFIHYSKDHNFIEINDDILNEYIKCDSKIYFNYKKSKHFIIEI